MMRASFAGQRQLAEFAASNLIDLSWTPWRRIMLSERGDTWCLVDADYYEGWLSDNVWNEIWGSRTPWQRYAKRNVGVGRETIRMHREIMIRADPRAEQFMSTHHVDHGNGQTLDNRRANLSWVTNRQNQANRRPRSMIPSLESVVLDLIAGLGPRPENVEVPF